MPISVPAKHRPLPPASGAAAVFLAITQRPWGEARGREADLCEAARPDPPVFAALQTGFQPSRASPPR